MIKLAIDAMGGDLGPSEVVKAVKKFLSTYDNVELFVVGDTKALEELSSLVTLVEATEVMSMEDSPLEILRRKNTSMMKAIELVANNTCDAVISSGSTGAFLTGATIKIKMIEGITRAALVSPFPKYNKKAVTILDIGANNENNSEQLVQFALIGTLFSKQILKVNNPNLYLLSNGSESSKGTPVIKETHQLLKNVKFANFKGNIEARDALLSDADVIVTGGFDGNILLKSIEGTASMMNSMIKDAFKKSLLTKIGYLFAKKGFNEMKDKLDYRQYGGAMLVGLKKVVVKAHGSSNDYALFNAYRVAKEMVELDIVNKLREEIKNGLGQTIN